MTSPSSSSSPSSPSPVPPIDSVFADCVLKHLHQQRPLYSPSPSSLLTPSPLQHSARDSARYRDIAGFPLLAESSLTPTSGADSSGSAPSTRGRSSPAPSSNSASSSVCATSSSALVHELRQVSHRNNTAPVASSVRYSFSSSASQSSDNQPLSVHFPTTSKLNFEMERPSQLSEAPSKAATSPSSQLRNLLKSAEISTSSVYVPPEPTKDPATKSYRSSAITPVAPKAALNGSNKPSMSDSSGTETTSESDSSDPGSSSKRSSTQSHGIHTIAPERRKSNSNITAGTAASSMAAKRLSMVPATTASPLVSKRLSALPIVGNPNRPSLNTVKSSEKLTSPTRSSPLASPDQPKPTAEITSLLPLFQHHKTKLYISGWLFLKKELDSHGNSEKKSEWVKCWVELCGSVLRCWSVADDVFVDFYRLPVNPKSISLIEHTPPTEIVINIKKSTQPTYINITDSTLFDLPNFPFPPSDDFPPFPFNNFFAVNTAGKNLIIFSASGEREKKIWFRALELSEWENGRINQYLTRLLFIDAERNTKWQLNEKEKKEANKAEGGVEVMVRETFGGEWRTMFLNTVNKAQMTIWDDAGQFKKKLKIDGETVLGLWESRKDRKKEPRMILKLKNSQAREETCKIFVVWPEKLELLENGNGVAKMEGFIVVADDEKKRKEREKEWKKQKKILENVKEVVKVDKSGIQRMFDIAKENGLGIDAAALRVNESPKTGSVVEIVKPPGFVLIMFETTREMVVFLKKVSDDCGINMDRSVESVEIDTAVKAHTSLDPASSGWGKLLLSVDEAVGGLDESFGELTRRKLRAFREGKLTVFKNELKDTRNKQQNILLEKWTETAGEWCNWVNGQYGLETPENAGYTNPTLSGEPVLDSVPLPALDVNDSARKVLAPQLAAVSSPTPVFLPTLPPAPPIIADISKASSMVVVLAPIQPVADDSIDGIGSSVSSVLHESILLDGTSSALNSPTKPYLASVSLNPTSIDLRLTSIALSAAPDPIKNHFTPMMRDNSASSLSSIRSAGTASVLDMELNVRGRVEEIFDEVRSTLERRESQRRTTTHPHLYKKDEADRTEHSNRLSMSLDLGAGLTGLTLDDFGPSGASDKLTKSPTSSSDSEGPRFVRIKTKDGRVVMKTVTESSDSEDGEEKIAAYSVKPQSKAHALKKGKNNFSINEKRSKSGSSSGISGTESGSSSGSGSGSGSRSSSGSSTGTSSGNGSDSGSGSESDSLSGSSGVTEKVPKNDMALKKTQKIKTNYEDDDRPIVVGQLSHKTNSGNVNQGPGPRSSMLGMQPMANQQSMTNQYGPRSPISPQPITSPRNMLNSQGSMLSPHALLNQQGMMMSPQGMMLSPQGMMLSSQGPMMNQHGMVMNQQGMMMNQQGMMMNSHDMMNSGTNMVPGNTLLGHVDQSQPAMHFGQNSLLTQMGSRRTQAGVAPNWSQNGPLMTSSIQVTQEEERNLAVINRNWAEDGPLLGTVDKDENKVQLPGTGLVGEMARRRAEKDYLKKIGVYRPQPTRPGGGNRTSVMMAPPQGVAIGMGQGMNMQPQGGFVHGAPHVFSGYGYVGMQQEWETASTQDRDVMRENWLERERDKERERMREREVDWARQNGNGNGMYHQVPQLVWRRSRSYSDDSSTYKVVPETHNAPKVVNIPEGEESPKGQSGDAKKKSGKVTGKSQKKSSSSSHKKHKSSNKKRRDETEDDESASESTDSEYARHRRRKEKKVSSRRRKKIETETETEETLSESSESEREDDRRKGKKFRDAVRKNKSKLKKASNSRRRKKITETTEGESSVAESDKNESSPSGSSSEEESRQHKSKKKGSSGHKSKNKDRNVGKHRVHRNLDEGLKAETAELDNRSNSKHSPVTKSSTTTPRSGSGYSTPKSQAAEALTEEVFSKFVDTCLMLKPKGVSDPQDLYDSFSLWWRVNMDGLDVPSMSVVESWMVDGGFSKRKRKDGKEGEAWMNVLVVFSSSS